MRSTTLPPTIAIVPALALGLLLACGGGGGGGSAPGDAPQPPVYDATGSWTITETAKDSNCPSAPVLETFTLEVDQPSGSSSLTVTDHGMGTTYTGVVDGATIRYAGPGANSDCPGGFSLSVSITQTSGTTLEGRADWSCNYAGGSCSGTTRFVGAKTASGDTTPPGTPANLTATPVSGTQVNLTWDAATDDVGVAGYNLYRAGVSTIHQTVSGTSAIDHGLSPDTVHCYRVAAFDAAGNESPLCAQVCARTLAGGGSDSTPPTAPTQVTATAISADRIDLAWTASSDDTGVAGYRVYRTGAPTNPVKNVVVPAASDTGLAADQNYCYTITAFDAAGHESAPSAQVCARTRPLGVPNAPSSLSATPLSSSSIRLGWVDNSSDETAFEIEETVSNLVPYAKIAEVPAGVTTFTHTGLAAATKYYYRVRAVNSAGPSTYAAATATTPAAPSTTQEFFPTRDNLVLYGSLNSALANASYPSAELGAGNEYYWNAAGGYDRTAAASLLFYDVMPAISGRTILSATLRLYPRVLPGDWNTVYRVYLLSGSWGTSVTWNTCPNWSLSPFAQASLPVSLAVPLEWDVTELVRRWANGSRANQGLVLWDPNTAPTYTPALRMTSFDSMNVYGSTRRRPVLAVEYR